MIFNEVFRYHFHYSFSNPESVKSIEINDPKIDLHSINQIFKKGHKIMVQIQSIWFSVIDRYPQRYVPNIFESKVTDFISANQRICRSLKYTSNFKLPVIERLVWMITFFITSKGLSSGCNFCPFGVPRGTRGQNRPLVSFFDILKLH